MIKKDIIIKDSIKFSNNRPGIYFLIYKKEIVYVGQSCNAMNRIYQHRKNRKLRFSSYYILYLDEISNEERLEVEIKYIALFKPEHNRKDNPNFVFPLRYKEDKNIVQNLINKQFKHYKYAAEYFNCSVTTIYNIVTDSPGLSDRTRNKILNHLFDNQNK